MTALLSSDCSIRVSRSFAIRHWPESGGAMAPLAPPASPPMHQSIFNVCHSHVYIIKNLFLLQANDCGGG